MINIEFFSAMRHPAEGLAKQKVGPYELFDFDPFFIRFQRSNGVSL
jgi:hypothetical protein